MFGEGDKKMGLKKNPPGPHDGYKVQLRSGAVATPPTSLLEPRPLAPSSSVGLGEVGPGLPPYLTACPSLLPALHRGW